MRRYLPRGAARCSNSKSEAFTVPILESRSLGPAVGTCLAKMDLSEIRLIPFYPGKCRLEIGQVGSELGVSTVNPESEGLGQLCVQSAPPLQAAGKECLLRPTGRILRLKGQGFDSPRLQTVYFKDFTLRKS